MIAIIVFSNVQVVAQQVEISKLSDTVQIATVDVSATVLEGRFNTIPGNISLLNAGKLSSLSELAIAEYLNTIPGVQVQSGTYNTNIFAMFNYKVNSRLLLTAGANVNRLNYSYHGKFNDEGAHRFPFIVSPRMGVNYEIISGLNIYASAGHGFSAPSLEETLLPDGEKNPEFNMNTRHSGMQYLDDGNTQNVEGYWLSNVKLSYRQNVRKRLNLKFDVGINNLFDGQYVSMILPNAPSLGANAPRYFYPGAPRNWYVKVGVGF